MGPGDPLLLTVHLAGQAHVRGSRAALVDDFCTLTFAELWDAVQAVAAGFAAYGVKPGDRVGFALTPSARYAVLIFGCMAAGATPCVLNTRLTRDELSRYVAPLELCGIVCDATSGAAATGLGAPLLLLENVLSCGSVAAQVAPFWRDPGPLPALRDTDIGFIVPTGGTTGEPKGAMLSHRALWLWCASCGAPRSRRPGDLELYFAPFFHVSVITGCFTTLFYGSTSRILDRFDPEKILDLIAAGATHLSGAPTTYSALRQSARFASIDRSRVREASFGSMAATPAFIEALGRDYPNAKLRHAFGSTEVGCATLMDHEDIVAGRAGVGYPPPGSTITVIDEALRPVPFGTVGEVAVACPWAMSGYWARPAETAAAFSDYGIRTGDLGIIDQDGWLVIVGRRKEMIITGGENVFPNEVESVLARHPAVREITVYGATDPHWGERVEAAVVVEPGMSLDLESLAAFGRESLAGYKLPKRIHLVDEIPLTPANKPDRRGLSQRANAAAAAP